MKKYVFTYIFLAIFVVGYCVHFYPKQLVDADSIERIEVLTPESEKYHNDCLHPCIRYSENGFAGYHYWMAQSPCYGWNNRIENPILYRSNTLSSIGKECEGLVIADTPKKGYNSDPNIFIDGDSVLYVFWRECMTPLCDSLNKVNVTVGISSRDGVNFSERRVYLCNSDGWSDIEQAPVLIKHDGQYLFYAAWYKYEPERKNKGVAIWQGTSLENPDFVLRDTIAFPVVYTVDKLAKVGIGRREGRTLLYLPKPHKFDLWHFDLLERNGKLLMVASEEKGDVIMMAESDDWKHFKPLQKPLISNHYMENYCGYRQYYYKPTALIRNDSLLLFYTSNDNHDPNQNILHIGKFDMKGF